MRTIRKSVDRKTRLRALPQSDSHNALCISKDPWRADLIKFVLFHAKLAQNERCD